MQNTDRKQLSKHDLNGPWLIPVSPSAKVYACPGHWLYCIDRNCLILQKGVFERLGYQPITQEEAIQRELRPCPFCACIPLPPEPLRVRIAGILQQVGRQLAYAIAIMAAVALITFIVSKINPEIIWLNSVRVLAPMMVVFCLVLLNLPIYNH